MVVMINELLRGSLESSIDYGRMVTEKRATQGHKKYNKAILAPLQYVYWSTYKNLSSKARY